MTIFRNHAKGIIIAFDGAVQPITGHGVHPGFQANCKNDDLYTASASGGGLEPLATGGGRFFYPAFAPDGQHLAFLEAPGGNVFNVNVIRPAAQRGPDSRPHRSRSGIRPSIR